jgi:hypothetical protein
MMMMTTRAFWFHSLEDNKDDKIDQKLNFPSEWRRNKETFQSFMQQRIATRKHKDKRNAFREKIF